VRVTIIGGGIVGYAAAYELASRGAAVRIIDPRGAGHGATYASAGVLAPYIEGHSEQLLELAVRGLAAYDGFIARLRSDTQRPIEYQRTGTLEVARDATEAAALEAAANRLAASGVAHSLLDAKQAREVEPALADRVSAGLLVPEHGYVVAAALIAALADAVERRGGTLSCDPVTHLEPAAGGTQVITASGTYETDAVVVAAGSWSGRVTSPAVPVRPIRGQLLQVRCPQPPISRVVWGSACYLVPWRDGALLIGATAEDVGFDERATADGVRRLLESAAEILPSTASATFEQVRVGLRPLIAGELPVIGASSTMRGVYYATGHYRNGVLLAPLTAALLADLVLDGRERPELALVTPRRLGL
jgi:glycine oxidase